ncbi:hypothetical protein P171DRAFT_456002 [Karstenula rhodostoma CBS 690.94]|uniref:C2H2-type domain-containing protein n=1 Tax=Karstenula rhodostoma CBS 690.94 TaxID=1392251 RepID=A0A9P4PHP5_9PLEO|nr:hypothetical protein P171DRAFT_456002 [Karstenula rhodostoma CBS 690.94]
MDDNMDIPEESMRHIEALLARHRPDMIHRMFQQAMESRRSSVASSHTASSISTTASTGSSFRSPAPSFRSSTTTSYHSRFSMQSNLSTSTLSSTMSSMAPSIASSTSSMSSPSRATPRRTEPRSYPASLDHARPPLDPTRPVPSMLTPSSEMESPIDPKQEPVYTPTDEDMSIASFPTDRGASLSGDSFMFCTYCAEAKTLKTFKAKSDWKKHEMRMHETGEDWPCLVNGCNRIFDRQKDFVKHHQRYHSGRPLPSLTDIGIQLLPRRVFGCGFDKCKEVSIGWDERCDHVAKHMKNGSTFDQWKYSNVIRNLIRQEALHDTWKEMIACLNERLRESRSQISWCPDNTRILRQKLQCCDLRPSREEVLITALSLRSDISLNPSQQQPPPGFVVPSRDSVPNVDGLSREQRMHILIGNPNATISRGRLAAVNAALLGASNASPNDTNFDCGSSPFDDGPGPDPDTSSRRISYMDIDTSEPYIDMSQQPIPQQPIPILQMPTPSHQHQQPPHSQPQAPPPMMETEQAEAQDFEDPAKSSNPLNLFYPSYFDASPQIEESHYYERPSLGQMISKPLQRIGNHRMMHGDMAPAFQIQSPVQMDRGFPHHHGHQPSMHVQQYPPGAGTQHAQAHPHQQQQQHQQQHQHHDQQLLFTSPI